MTGVVGNQRCPVDLHLHTVASDGEESPEVVAERCVQAGVRVAAVTDHHTMTGTAAFRRAASDRITVIPACEISTSWRGVDAHCLAYWVPDDDPRFADRLADLQHVGLRWWQDWVALAREAGVPLRWAQVEREIGIGRVCHPGAYLRLFLNAAGDDRRFREYAPDNVQRLAEEWCRPGKPLHLPAMRWPDLAEVIGWIVQAGGVAVLAHPAPLLSRQDTARPMIAQLRAAGLSGIEVWTTWHTASQSAQLSALCGDFDLVATAGSDYHGIGVKPWAVGPGLLPSVPEDPMAIVDELYRRRSGGVI